MLLTCSVVTISARSCVGYWILFGVTLSQMFSGYKLQDPGCKIAREASSVCLMQLANYTLHNHCLFSSSATKKKTTNLFLQCVLVLVLGSMSVIIHWYSTYVLGSWIYMFV